MLEIHISRTDRRIGSPRTAELIVSGLVEPQTWEVAFDEPVTITQVCEWSLPPESIIIEKVPVYWKWFPWLPVFHEYLVQTGGTVLIETVTGWGGTQYRFRQSVVDRVVHRGQWFKTSARFLNKIGYEFLYEDRGTDGGKATIADNEDLPIALALTSLFWFSDVTMD